MSKQIIALSKTESGIYTTFQVAFWFPITTGVQTQTNGSVWTGASSTENAAIQAGTVREKVESFSFPTGASAAVIEGFLLQCWTNANAQINGVGPNQIYGSYYDPAAGGWTIA